ncbi:phosphate ABC transporter substrate-binding protein [Cobetia marina]|uniref:PstS family phosphate ABC transporter substrate-binding protein n=1 Tax=Cobetia marina TaxID=28258 RepID=UPI00174B4F41|nr:phosphate ABC transporter substrate-binding protein [Cobetia marina]MDO6787360.1 phosphate ABC transporter substrate-binding protein [Cobetia marina]
MFFIASLRRPRWLSSRLALLACLLMPVVPAFAEVPEYRPVPGVVGNLTAVGSDTLSVLVTRWAAQLRRYHPGVRVQLQAAGSSTAPPALIAGTTRVGLMSRPMSDQERQDFIRAFGYPPLEVPVALDAMGILVHRRNPLETISIAQLDAIFSASHECGSQRADRWGQLGLSGDWAERQISRFGRSATSGTYGAFRRVALCGGDFRLDVSEQPGSASIIGAVGSSPGGIGYASFSTSSPMVKQLSVSRDAGSMAIFPSRASIRDGRYPLTRALYIYVNRVPDKPLPSLEQAFLSLIMSRQGQQAILREGYVPLPDDQLNRWRERLGLDEGEGL